MKNLCTKLPKSETCILQSKIYKTNPLKKFFVNYYLFNKLKVFYNFISMIPSQKNISSFINRAKSLKSYEKISNPFKLNEITSSNLNSEQFSCKEFAKNMCYRKNCPKFHGISIMNKRLNLNVFGEEIDDF